MTRIVMDTNIFISALAFGGVPRQVVSLARDGKCDGFTSEAIREETIRVMVNKFGWTEAAVREELTWATSGFTFVSPTDTISGIVVDDSDHRILECAVTAKAEIIVSGDKHLVTLGEYEGIRILTARQFLDEMLK